MDLDFLIEWPLRPDDIASHERLYNEITKRRNALVNMAAGTTFSLDTAAQLLSELMDLSAKVPMKPEERDAFRHLSREFQWLNKDLNKDTLRQFIRGPWRDFWSIQFDPEYVAFSQKHRTKQGFTWEDGQWKIQ